VIVSPGTYSANKMEVRNRWMVDNSNGVVALWDGRPGGTGNCVRYVLKSKSQIDNLWLRWETGHFDLDPLI
jgi:uncharacterized phage-like protein YoqJ